MRQLKAQLQKPVPSLTTTHVQDYAHIHLCRHTYTEIFKYGICMTPYLQLGTVFQFPVSVTCREAVILNTF